MTEDAAATVWLASQLGKPREIPVADIARLPERYTNDYGQ
jgi:hypothetical protein